MLKHVILIAAVLATGACKGPEIITRDRPVVVRVPAIQPCSTARPAAVVPLNQRLARTHWYGEMDVRQKAAAVGRQVDAHASYGESLTAATGACP